MELYRYSQWRQECQGNLSWLRRIYGVKEDGTAFHWGFRSGNYNALDNIDGNIKDIKAGDSGWIVLTNEGSVKSIGAWDYRDKWSSKIKHRGPYYKRL